MRKTCGHYNTGLVLSLAILENLERKKSNLENPSLSDGKKTAGQSQGIQRRCYCCAHLYSSTLMHLQQMLEPFPAEPLISPVSMNTKVNSSELFNSA